MVDTHAHAPTVSAVSTRQILRHMESCRLSTEMVRLTRRPHILATLEGVEGARARLPTATFGNGISHNSGTTRLHFCGNPAYTQRYVSDELFLTGSIGYFVISNSVRMGVLSHGRR